MSDTLHEAMRWLNGPKLTDSETLRDQIINTVLVSEQFSGPHGSDVERIVSGLVIAYRATLAFEHDADDDYELDLLEPAEAEQLLIRMYCKVIVSQIEGYDEERACEGWAWPEALSYTACYERKLVRDLGVALGYMEARRTLAWFEHCRREDAKEAANG